MQLTIGINSINMSDLVREKEEEEEVDLTLASIGEVFSFAQTIRTKAYFALGIFFAIIAGLAFPASIFYFTRIMGDITAIEQEGMGPVLEIIYARMILGVVSLVSETLHSEWIHGMIPRTSVSS